MADKRYELSAIFHSALDDGAIADEFWQHFGGNASISIKQIHDWSEDDERDPAKPCDVPACAICGGPPEGGWVDLKKQPSALVK